MSWANRLMTRKKLSRLNVKLFIKIYLWGCKIEKSKLKAAPLMENCRF
jgi:hypothetical protein